MNKSQVINKVRNYMTPGVATRSKDYSNGHMILSSLLSPSIKSYDQFYGSVSDFNISNINPYKHDVLYFSDPANTLHLKYDNSVMMEEYNGTFDDFLNIKSIDAYAVEQKNIDGNYDQLYSQSLGSNKVTNFIKKQFYNSRLYIKVLTSTPTILYNDNDEPLKIIVSGLDEFGKDIFEELTFSLPSIKKLTKIFGYVYSVESNIVGDNFDIAITNSPFLGKDDEIYFNSNIDFDEDKNRTKIYYNWTLDEKGNLRRDIFSLLEYNKAIKGELLQFKNKVYDINLDGIFYNDLDKLLYGYKNTKLYIINPNEKFFAQLHSLTIDLSTYCPARLSDDGGNIEILFRASQLSKRILKYRVRVLDKDNGLHYFTTNSFDSVNTVTASIDSSNNVDGWFENPEKGRFGFQSPEFNFNSNNSCAYILDILDESGKISHDYLVYEGADLLDYKSFMMSSTLTSPHILADNLIAFNNKYIDFVYKQYYIKEDSNVAITLSNSSESYSSNNTNLPIDNIAILSSLYRKPEEKIYNFAKFARNSLAWSNGVDKISVTHQLASAYRYQIEPIVSLNADDPFLIYNNTVFYGNDQSASLSELTVEELLNDISLNTGIDQKWSGRSAKYILPAASIGTRQIIIKTNEWVSIPYNRNEHLLDAFVSSNEGLTVTISDNKIKVEAKETRNIVVIYIYTKRYTMLYYSELFVDRIKNYKSFIPIKDSREIFLS